jgi:hypothetical protein
MPNFAIIENNVVVNVIVCDTKEIAENITKLQAVEFNLDSHEAGIGFTYDKNKFIAPPKEEEILDPRYVEFLKTGKLP